MDQLLFGCLLAIQEDKIIQYPKWYFKFFIVSLFSIIPVAFGVYYFQEIFPNIKEMLKYPILSLLFYAIIGLILATSDRTIINRFLSSKPLRYLGKISYGIYIWHVLILSLLEKYLIFENLIIDLFLSFSLTILIAHLSFYYFESHFLNIKNKLYKNKLI